jgi:DNA replication protein DnaC
MLSWLHRIEDQVAKTFYDGKSILEAAKEHETVIIHPLSPHNRDRYVGPTDVVSEAILGAQYADSKADVRGMQAETAVFHQFQYFANDVKGILLHGFCFRKIAQTRKIAGRQNRLNETVDEAAMLDEYFGKIKSRQLKGEADFIFLHPDIGICLIEVKSGRMKTARKQLENLEDQIVWLYKEFIGSIAVLPKIYKLICLPFTSSTDLSNLHFSDCEILCAETFAKDDSQGFVEFFTSKMLNKLNDPRAFVKFCAFLISLKIDLRDANQYEKYIRKQMHERLVIFRQQKVIGQLFQKRFSTSKEMMLFISNMKDCHLSKKERRKRSQSYPKSTKMNPNIDDALDIKTRNRCNSDLTFTEHTHIALDSSDFERSPKFYQPDADHASSIWLTKEQRIIAHSNAKKCILTGPPGSGKSIMLMLKILAASKKHRSIYIICPHSLINWYHQFVIRNNILSANIFDYQNLSTKSKESSLYDCSNPKISIFCDEMDLRTLADGYNKLLKKITESKDAEAFVVGVSPQIEMENVKVR